MFEILYVALSSGLIPTLFNLRPSFQDGHNARRSQVGTIEIHSITLKQNLFLQNCLAQVLEIYYVLLPGGR